MKFPDSPYRLLCVGAPDNIGLLIKHIDNPDYNITICKDITEANSILKESLVDLILSDSNINDVLERKKKDTPVICIPSDLAHQNNACCELLVNLISTTLEKSVIKTNFLRTERLHSYLSYVNKFMVRNNDKNKLFNAVTTLAVERGPFIYSWAAAVSRKKFILKSASGNFNPEKFFPLPAGTERLIQLKKNFLVNDVPPEMRLPSKIKSFIILPLISGDTIKGVAGFYSAEKNFFNDAEIALLEELVDDVSYSISFIENIEMNNEVKKALKESESKYQNIFRNMFNALGIYKIITDETGKPADYIFIDVNPAYEKMTGLSYADVIGKRFSEVFPQIVERDPGWINDFCEMALNNRRIHREDYLENFDKWISANSFSMGNGYFAVILEDITIRKTSEDRLKRSESRFRTIFQKSPVGTYLQELDSMKFVDVNDSLLEIFGFTREEVLGKNTLDLNVWMDLSVRERLYNELKEKGYVQNFEGELRNKINEKVNILASVEVVEIQKKKFMLGMITDITENRKNSEKVKLQSALLDSVGQAVIATENSGKIIYWNKAAESLYGYSVGEVSDKLIKETVSDLKADPEIRQDIMRGTSRSKELTVERKDGIKINAAVTYSPFYNDIGEFKGIVSVSKDVSERLKYQRELLRAKETAEELNKVKSMFLANMSHELRTPLCGIIGLSEILKSSFVNNEQSEMIDGIYVNGKRLQETLDMILELSNMESKEFIVHKVQFSISEIIHDQVNFYKSAALFKNINLYAAVMNDKLNVVADERLFKNAMGNLISNAIKFTNEGEISITVYKDVEGSGVIEVADSGIGIPSEHIDKIFEPFRQVSEGYNRSFEGTGLGLTLAKRSIEMMNGSITVTSVPGKGSVFQVKLPLI